jgi:hypothetical protein
VRGGDKGGCGLNEKDKEKRTMKNMISKKLRGRGRNFFKSTVWRRIRRSE